MLHARARLRYLAAIGLPAVPAAIGVAACQNTTENTTAVVPTTPTVTIAPPVEPTASATATATATASATQPAEPLGAWVPKLPPRPPTDRPRGECPNGPFCISQAGAPAGAAAPAPFETCAAEVPVPPDVRQSGRMSLHVSFQPDITRQERARDPSACCYKWVIPCPGGRPLVSDTGPVTAPPARRDDWLAAIGPIAGVASPVESCALAAHWAREAAFEHASIAAFSRASLALLALGAPAELVARTHAAALDEIEHARIAYALASAYGGAAAGPGRLDVSSLPPVAADPERLAVETFTEACVGETVAALALREAAAGAANPAIARVLLRIAEDEERHAELAWQTVAWAARSFGEGVTRALREAVASLRREPGEAEDEGDAAAGAEARLDLTAHGVPGSRRQAAIRRRAIADVVLPCADALLGRCQSLCA